MRSPDERTTTVRIGAGARAVPALLAACVLAAAPAACRPRPTDAASAAPVQPSARPDATPESSISRQKAPPASHTAASIEVSRLSRVDRGRGRRPLIDVRLDALDASGLPARLGGAMRVVVRAPGAEPAELVYDFPMSTQLESDRRLDTTLKQYVLRIEPNWKAEPASGSFVDIAATITPVSGPPLEARGVVEW